MYSISTLINTSNGNVPKRMHMLRDTYNGQRFSLTIIKPFIHFLTRIWKQVIKANWWILMHPQLTQVIFFPACSYSASHSSQSWTCAKHLNPKTRTKTSSSSSGPSLRHRHPLQRVYPQSYSFHCQEKHVILLSLCYHLHARSLFHHYFISLHHLTSVYYQILSCIIHHLVDLLFQSTQSETHS